MTTAEHEAAPATRVPVSEHEMSPQMARMARRSAAASHDVPSYKEMVSAESMDKLVWHLVDATSQTVVDIHDILQFRFGIDSTQRLYERLYEVPALYRRYRDEFAAEDRVGCSDRAIGKIVAEIEAAAIPSQPMTDPSNTHDDTETRHDRSAIMAAYETRTKTTARHEFVLPNPTNWAELSKALSAIKHDVEAHGLDSRYDDIVTVKATEEEIILFWEENPVEGAR